MTIRELLKGARLVLSFTLLGAVIAGSFFGWVDSSIDPRTFGAAFGASGALLLKALHLV